MTISRNDSREAVQAPAEHFTGMVRIDPRFQSQAPARAAGAYVSVPEALDGKAVEWLDKVNDEQYRGKA